MKKNVFLCCVFVCFAMVCPMANAMPSGLDCPSPDRITTVENPPVVYFWYAPQLPSSDKYGFGYGGANPGSFVLSAEIDSNKDWICVYQSSSHASFTAIQDAEFKSHTAGKLHLLPNDISYGFLMYSPKK